MGRERGAGGLAEAWYDVDGALWEADLGREFGQAQRRQAGVLGGFDHGGIAHREGGGHGPAEHLGRVVPGDDVADDAMRDVLGRDEVAGQERDRVAVDLVGRAAVIFEVAGRGDHIGSRLLQGLAGVARFELSQFLGMIGDGGAELGEQAPALERAHPTPGARKRRACGLHGAGDVGFVAGRDLGERDAFGRCHGLQGLARSGRRPAVRDEHAFRGDDGRRMHVHDALPFRPLKRPFGS